MSEEKKNEVLGQEKELSMDEMDAVAGGGACACPLFGGGAEDENSIECVCMVGGAGVHLDGGTRCACPAIGGGVA